MRKILRNKRAQSGEPVGVGIGAIIALLIGVLIFMGLATAAGLQFNFLQAFTGSPRGEFLIVAQGPYPTAYGSTNPISIVGALGTSKPKVSEYVDPDDRVYAIAAGSFRGRGDEIAVLLSNYKIKAIPSDYVIVDDFGDQYMKDKCKISKMYAADVVGEGKEDLFIAANCAGSIALGLYRITDINDFGSNKANYFVPSIGLVDEGHIAFADFDGDGKQDLAFANFYKQSGIQIIKIFYDFDKASGNFKESKEIERRSNMRITAMVAGNFTGSKRPDLLFFTEGKELFRIKNLDVTKEPYPGAFRIADVAFEVDNNKELIYGFDITVKQSHIIPGNFKGDAKQELLVYATDDSSGKVGGEHLVMLSSLDKDTIESSDLNLAEMIGTLSVVAFTTAKLS